MVLTGEQPSFLSTQPPSTGKILRQNRSIEYSANLGKNEGL